MWLLYLLGLAGLNELASIDNKLAKKQIQIDPQNDPRTCRFIKMNDGKGHQFVIDQSNINVIARLNHTWSSFWKAVFTLFSCVMFAYAIDFIMVFRHKFVNISDADFGYVQLWTICGFTVGALITFFSVRGGLKYMKKRGRVSLPDLGIWSIFLYLWAVTFYVVVL